MKTNDILTAYISWPGGGKSRPIYVINDDGEKIRFYKITSKYINKTNSIKRMYFPINDWKASGLYKPSYIDTITVGCLLKKKFKIKYVGKLSSKDAKRFVEFLENTQ